MNCNSTPPCMFLLEKRMGCAWKNKTIKDLSGCGEHRIYDRKNYIGIDFSNKRSKPRQAIDHVEIKRLIQSGKTARKIMEIVKISPPHLYNMARKMGLKIKPPTGYSVLDINIIREMAGRDLTAQEIAEKLNSKVETVRSRAKRNGIKLKHGNVGRPSHNLNGRPKLMQG